MTDEQFWARVMVADCWEWTGTRAGHGYGYFTAADRAHPAHRYAYQLLVGPIPTGLQLDHLCRNRACVNPDHLEIVTRRENILRGVSPSARSARATSCPKGHPYDAANTYLLSGKRYCRACRANRTAYAHQWYLRKKARAS